jgi:PPP family 3-phenylpropionic acid transporter
MFFLLLQRTRRLSALTRGALFYFGFFAAGASYLPFLPAFYAHQGLTGQEIGLLAAIGPLIALLLVPGTTALADRYCCRVRLLSLALAGSGVVLLGMLLPTSFATFLPVAVLLALCSSAIIPLADGLIAPRAARRGLAYGKMRLWGSISWALLAAAGGALWQQVGFAAMFPVAGALFLGTALVVQLLPEERPATAQARLPLRTVLADGRLRVVLGASLLFGLGLAMTATFGGVYLDQVSGRWLVGLFAGVAAISELPTMHVAERLQARWGGPTVLLLSYGLLGASWLGLARIQQPEWLLGVAVVRGIGAGLYIPTIIRVVAGWAPAGRAATYLGLLNAGTVGLAPLGAGLLGGTLYDAAGPQAVFLLCVGTAGLAGLLLGVAQLGGVFHRREPARPVLEPVGTE